MGLNQVAAPRPHDLLRLAPTATILGQPGNEDAPAWVRRELARTPWVVVRRGAAKPGRIPVGVRGSTRSERWATTVSDAEVTSVTAPEDLRPGGHRPGDRGDVPPDVAAIRALLAVAASLERWAWGPTGSVGFSLATRHAVVGDNSDLDLLIRIPRRPAPHSLDHLATVFGRQEARVDCLVETPNGIVHLDKLRGDGSPVVVRTSGGAELCADPWGGKG